MKRTHFVDSGGYVAFNDARKFEGSWPKETDGYVRQVSKLFLGCLSTEWRIADEVHSQVIVERT
jgi:hypothetical protein